MAKSKLPQLTDAERHARFVELAREAEAEGEAPTFDRTVKRLAEQDRDEPKKG